MEHHFGRVAQEFGPCAGNPRNSEGSFYEKEGKIIFCYTSFLGDAARDFTSANISMTESSDDGMTWSAPRVIVTNTAHNAMNVMSVSLLPMQDGTVGMFYLVRMSWSDMMIYLRRSGDMGNTWSEAVCCSPRAGYYVMNNDRAVRLASGRILLPVAEHVPTYDADGKVKRFSAATFSAVYSDDDGATWNESENTLSISNLRSKAGLQEPGVVELKGGWLYGWARTDLMLQYEFLSRDGGKTWTCPQPSRFTSPLSPMSVKRVPDGRLIALWNPIPEYETRNADRKTGGRTPLVIAFSEDEGNTWSAARIVEDDEKSGYCYTAVHFTKDAMLLGYCAGDPANDKSCLNRLRIRRVPFCDLTAVENADDNAHAMMGIGIG